MNIRVATVVLVIIALGVGLWVAFGNGSGPTQLVPAWALTPPGEYDGQAVADEVVSWSPDSTSLLFTAANAKMPRTSIFRWKVGGKRIERVAYGASPNYVDDNKFIFLRMNPMTFYQLDLATGRLDTLVPRLRSVDYWKDISGFTYDRARKTIGLRFANFPRFYEPATQEIDLVGKTLGRIPRATGDGIVSRSNDPKGGRSAVIIGEVTGDVQELRIAKQGEEKQAKTAATGALGAVAWSPDGRDVAFGDSNEIKLLNPDTLTTLTIARLGDTPPPGKASPVVRLYWSPDGKYLAALQLTPAEFGSNQMLYVLDMSKLAR